MFWPASSFQISRATRNLDMTTGGRAAQLYDAHIFDLVIAALGIEGEARDLAEQRGIRAARRSVRARSSAAAVIPA